MISPRGWPEDHPRSRGVYGGLMRELQEIAGSSPLARGLRAPVGPIGVQVGIIPARAGFTRCASRRHSLRRDHPRSRGVYLEEFMAPNVSYGSSPLARGLPGGQRQRRLLRGIIPARAGFTRVRHWLIDGARDHPRSRGVYRDGETSNGVGPGSSPLARGLPGGVRGGGTGYGIIPARAGFTGRPK